LVYCAFILLTYILADSHGRIALNNKETLSDLGILSVFILAAILAFLTRSSKTNRWLIVLSIIVNLCAIILIGNQAYWIYPYDPPTTQMVVIIVLHVVGILLGIALIANSLFFLFKKKGTP
jgi:hypothetical protein